MLNGTHHRSPEGLVTSHMVLLHPVGFVSGIRHGETVSANRDRLEKEVVELLTAADAETDAEHLSQGEGYYDNVCAALFVLYDRTGSYDIVWYISIALGVFAALVNLPVRESPIARQPVPQAA